MEKTIGKTKDRKFLAIQHNSDGRPCGWGTSDDQDFAKGAASEQYLKHECYPGERAGKLVVWMFLGPEEGFMDVSQRWFIALAPNYWGGGQSEAEALANLRKQSRGIRRYSIYSCPPGTMVDSLGGWTYPSEFKGAGPVLVKQVGKR